MAVAYSPDSKYAKEMVKWEANYGPLGAPGRPYVYYDYPVHVCRASRPATGGQVTFETLEAGDEQEERNLLSRGFVRGRDKALAALETSEFAVAELTANRHYNDRRMSEPAQREAAAFDARTAAHVPVIPEKPRRGRKPKSEVSNG